MFHNLHGLVAKDCKSHLPTQATGSPISSSASPGPGSSSPSADRTQRENAHQEHLESQGATVLAAEDVEADCACGGVDVGLVDGR